MLATLWDRGRGNTGKWRQKLEAPGQHHEVSLPRKLLLCKKQVNRDLVWVMSSLHSFYSMQPSLSDPPFKTILAQIMIVSSSRFIALVCTTHWTNKSLPGDTGCRAISLFLDLYKPSQQATSFWRKSIKPYICACHSVPSQLPGSACVLNRCSLSDYATTALQKKRGTFKSLFQTLQEGQ